MDSLRKQKFYTTLKYSKKVAMFFRILFILGMAGLVGATIMTYCVFSGLVQTPDSVMLVEMNIIQKNMMDSFGMEIWFLVNMVFKSSFLIIPIFKFPKSFSNVGWLLGIVIADICVMVFIIGMADFMNDLFQLSLLLSS